MSLNLSKASLWKRALEKGMVEDYIAQKIIAGEVEKGGRIKIAV